MSTLKGSRTEKNLLTAFAGESQARNRYSFAADKAKKEGFEKVAAIFEVTAEQERAHAKKLFGFLQGGEVEISAAFPAGVVGTTVENLKAAAGGEHHEYSSMYPDFARIAREEGFENVAKLFDAIAVSERYHERRFLALAETIESGRMFKREAQTEWYCRKCGYVHAGEEPPDFCPACSHAKSYFEALGDQF